jgi:hypothetical protein
MLMTKSIGKPYAGKLHVRFDEGAGMVHNHPALLYCPQADGDLVVYFLFQNKELIPAPQNNNLPLITKSQ